MSDEKNNDEMIEQKEPELTEEEFMQKVSSDMVLEKIKELGLEDDVAKWKQAYPLGIEAIIINQELYIYRGMTYLEARNDEDMQANMDDEEADFIITAKCSLYPKLTSDILKNEGSGLVRFLTNRIMKLCKLLPDTQPIVL